MTCTEVDRQVEAWLAGDRDTLGLDAAATSHVGQCDRCRELTSRLDAVDEAGVAAEGVERRLSESLTANREALRRRFAELGRPIVRFDWLSTPIGRVYVGVSDRGVCDVTFDATSERDYRTRLAPRAPEVVRDREAVEPAVVELDEYFSRTRQRFSVAVDLRGVTPFTARVLEAIREIPFGGRWRYGDVARRIGAPSASRAVGGALGRNPVPIVVPCHRVVAGSGLGGFTGGLDTKRALLGLEAGDLLEAAERVP